MSYAVIQTGGKQYKVRSGEILKVEKLPNSKPDAKIEFKEILAYGNDETIEVGAPTVQGAKVEANLIKNSKNRTILIFKKRIMKVKTIALININNGFLLCTGSLITLTFFLSTNLSNSPPLVTMYDPQSFS